MNRRNWGDIEVRIVFRRESIPRNGGVQNTSGGIHPYNWNWVKVGDSLGKQAEVRPGTLLTHVVPKSVSLFSLPMEGGVFFGADTKI